MAKHIKTNIDRIKFVESKEEEKYINTFYLSVYVFINTDLYDDGTFFRLLGPNHVCPYLECGRNLVLCSSVGESR